MSKRGFPIKKTSFALVLFLFLFNYLPGAPIRARVSDVHASDTTARAEAEIFSIKRVSVASDGTQGDNASAGWSISADGRFVSFYSYADNLVSGDTNGLVDIFVNDGQTGETTRVSVASDGSQGNGDSDASNISADGRYVTFVSAASNLVSGDTNGVRDIFMHDRQTGETTRISLASDGTQANGESQWPFMTPDARYVVFDSAASNLVSGDTNDELDVFMLDRQTGETTRISVASDGTEAVGNGLLIGQPTISPDGRYVTFMSAAGNLVSGDTNGIYDVFIHDRQTGQTERVSVASDGTQGNGRSETTPFSPMSPDGRYVAFESDASNLVEDDTNNTRDIFIHDRQTGQTTRMSVTPDGVEGNGRSYSEFISADGRFLLFGSESSNLVDNDTNNFLDVFMYNFQTSQIERVSVAADGSEGNDYTSVLFSMSADGHYIVLTSRAGNFVIGDTNNTGDVFVRSYSSSPVNHAPTDLNLSNTSVAENLAIGTPVGSFTTTDPDTSDSFTYTLATGEGDADNGSFIIDGENLKTNAVFDYETKNDYSIRIQTDDGHGGIFQKQFTISVTDANDIPTNLSLSNTSLAENQPIGTLVGSLTTTDADDGDTFTYSLVSGTGDVDNVSFIIDGENLKTNAVFDYETKNGYSIRIQTDDGHGGTFQKQFTISVTDANDIPTNLSLSNTSLAENQPIGTLVGSLTTTDADDGDTFTYSLVPGAGCIDNIFFKIDRDSLKTRFVLDYEWKSIYSIRVQTDDGHGGKFQKQFSIELTNENDAGIYDDTDATILYNGNWLAGTTVGMYKGTYHLSSEIGSTASFTFRGNRIFLFYYSWPEFGAMDITIDGIRMGRLNMASYHPRNLLLWSSAYFPPGEHTLTLTHAAGPFVDVDAIAVSGPPFGFHH